MNEENSIQFIQHDPPKPTGTPVTDHKTAGPLTKMVSKMLTPKLKMPRGKGIQSNQNVKIGHKKSKHPNPITYW